MVLSGNPVLEEGLATLKNRKTLHKLPQFVFIVLALVLFLTGPKEIKQYVQSSSVPLSHLFTWIIVIIGFIGINLYWAGDIAIVYAYSPIKKWFSYTELTPRQFFIGKVYLSCIETFFYFLLVLPFITMSMALGGFEFVGIFPVLIIVFTNLFMCRIITVYFQSTYKGKKFPFSLNSLLMYFWIMVLYIGTIFINPYWNIFSVLLTLEPTTDYLFSSLTKLSVLQFPFLAPEAGIQTPHEAVWIISLCIHLFIIAIVCVWFYGKLYFIKRHYTLIKNRKETE